MSQVFSSSAELRWRLSAQEGQCSQLLKWLTRQEQLAVRKERCSEPKDYGSEAFVKREQLRLDKYIPIAALAKEFLEAGKKRLAGDTAREATSDEVKELKAEARQLKETLAEVLIENRLLKKSVLGDGEDAS